MNRKYCTPKFGQEPLEIPFRLHQPEYILMTNHLAIIMPIRSHETLPELPLPQMPLHTLPLHFIVNLLGLAPHQNCPFLIVQSDSICMASLGVFELISLFAGFPFQFLPNYSIDMDFPDQFFCRVPFRNRGQK